MKIAIASGKGGTGKSTVAVNLAVFLTEYYPDKKTVLLDCDVEEPNCHIFLRPEIEKTFKVLLPVPDVNNEKCTGCGKCVKICQFNVLALVKTNVMVFPELCHSCGGCWLVCPEGAISKGSREAGEIESGKYGALGFVQGRTKIGEPMSPPVINAVKAEPRGYDMQIIDSPPGTSCPMIAATDGADYVVLVTEPTPFGLYDLRLAVDVVKKLKFRFGIVINKSSENDILIEEYANSENIKILGKIPDSRKIAEVYSRGEIITEKLPEFREVFKTLSEKILEAVR